MHAIFQKKGKKGKSIQKLEQKGTKFENILKKGSWLRAIIACNKLPEQALVCDLFQERVAAFTKVTFTLVTFKRWDGVKYEKF